jgi:hypothetical protein
MEATCTQRPLDARADEVAEQALARTGPDR